jgi:rare lipoprotein A (peptidoglycan hydrolase)
MTTRTRAVGALTLAAAAIPAASGAQTAAPAQPVPTPKLRVAARHHIHLGTRAPVEGTLTSGASGRRIVVQIRSGRRWKTVARTRTRAGGRFAARWRGSRLGRFSLRVVAPGTAAKPRTVHGKVAVYRAASASWYGPGLYGNKLACGGTLTPGTLGVANKSLPCGTRVTLRYRGRTVTVPVVDRGPYVAGRVYDLTSATKQRLRFGSTGSVWATK